MRAGRIGAIAVACLFGWAGGASLTAAHAAACNTTAPGTTCSAPDSLGTSTSSTLVAQKTGTLDSCTSSVTQCFTASYVEDVYRDPSNTFCSNCLDWLVQLTDNAVSSGDTVDPIKNITIGNFQGFQTDSGTDSNAPPSGSGLSSSGTATPNGPEAVSRDASGQVLGWEFNNPEITPVANPTTVVLDVMTNATQVIPGQISAQDSSANSQPALAPALPEAPVVIAFMFVGGLAAFFVLRRLRRQTATQ